MRIHRAYRLADNADELAGEGRHREAASLYRRASELEPDNHELKFWAGIGAAEAGDLETALADVRASIDAHPPWRQLLASLPSRMGPLGRRGALTARIRGVG